MVGLKTSIIAVGLFISSAWASYPANDEEDSALLRIRLDSFVWWDKYGDNHWSYPKGSIPSPSSSFDGIALSSQAQYEIQWSNTDPNYPVLLEWMIPSDTNQWVTWSQNISEARFEFSFTFDELIKDFPTKQFNVSQLEVRALATQGFTHFNVSQPERPVEDANKNITDPYTVSSSPFIIYDQLTAMYFQVEYNRGRQDMYNKWKIPVGASVGVGVPVLMGLAFVAGLFLKKFQSRRTHEPLLDNTKA